MENNKEYSDYLRRWNKTRAFAFGDEHEVKELAHDVIPRLIKESDADYKQRINYAHVDNKVAASMWIFKGLAFRKSPILSKLSNKQQIYIDDVDGCGTDIISFAKKLHEEHIAVTRYGLLVDAIAAVDGENIESYRERGGRSKICFYSAESILDWQVIDGELAYVLLKECETHLIFNEDKGKFEKEIKDVLRSLDILDGNYRVMRWQLKSKHYGYAINNNNYEMIGDPVYPLIDGKPINLIPFKILPEIEPSVPMIMGLVNANIAHLKADVMDANLCRLIATPTPILAGFSELSDPQKNNELNLSAAITTNNPSAKFGYLEMSGNGVSAIQARMARLLDEMVSEGSSLLKSSPKAVESAESAGIRNMGDNSKLLEVSLSVESALNWAINLLFEWDKIEGDEFKIELNHDLLPYTMSPQMIDSLLRGVQIGEISRQTLFYNLQKGEMYDNGRTFEEENGALNEM